VKIFCVFQDQNYVHIVSEYIQGGELFSWSRYYKGMKEEQAKVIVAEIIIAFEFLHKKNIIYRDLKPENVLIDRTGHIKITDFGFAKNLKNARKTLTTCGTPECLAPEVILGLGQDKAVDFWALGILIYELLIGVTPFNAQSNKEIYQNIIKKKVLFPKKISSSAKDLILRLLEKDPKARLGCTKLGIDEIKRHKWFSNIKWDKVANRTIKPPIEVQVTSENDLKYFPQYKDSVENLDEISKEEQNLFKEF